MTIYAGETTKVRATITDPETGYPQTPLPGGVTYQVMSSDELTEILAESQFTLVVRDTGTATAGGARTLTDTGQAWIVDEWRNAGLRITSGTGAGQERRVKSNTADTLTIDHKQNVDNAPVGDWNPAPDATSVYELHRAEYTLLWDVPAAQADKEVIGITRAIQVGVYTAVPDKQRFRVEGRSV